VPQSVLVIDNEIIHTTDTPALTGPALVIDNETIHTTDTPTVPQSVLVLDNEIIHTTDTPSLTGPAIVIDNETIHTTDTPTVPQSVLVLDNEIIHTTDAASVPQSVLVLDNEIIHTTDTPTAQILSSPTTTVLTSSTAAPLFTAPVTFTATVSSPGGTPTGSVTFFDGPIALGTVALSNGTATFTTSALNDGAHSISAVYAGTPYFLTSTSGLVSVNVIDFTLSFSGPDSSGIVITIFPGNSGTYAITLVQGAGGDNEVVTFSAHGLPAGATATFNPNPVTLPGSAASSTSVASTLTITIPASGGQVQPQWPDRTKPFLMLAALLPLIGLCRATKRRWLRLLSMALLSIFISMGIGSCGGGFYSQPPQTYVVTITATSGTLQHSATIDLTVP
jgi:hypothetical protein